ncbi:MAG TPA: hypothetical protein PLI47_06325 [Bacteroidia bacterium]|nr:hypothetical protein [Bacteroidia bacterium]HQW22896.1 hypothetical protein [Bacteroidia bacterium]
MKKKLNIILLSIIGNAGLAFAQSPAIISSDKSGWHKIAETTVDFTKERDEVAVLMADKFASLQFKVQDAAIDLISLEVLYDNGEKQNIDINSPIKAHSQSAVIKINGGERSIKTIAFVYKTMPNSKDTKAHVEIWGLKTNTDEKKAMNADEKKAMNTDEKKVVYTDDKKVTGSAPIIETSVMVSDKKGWHKIGERTVDFTKDTDEIIVTGADRFASLQFKAIDASVHLMSVEVYYDAGEKQIINVNSPLSAGTASRVIDLKGVEKDLKKIVFVYKTIPNQTADKATLEVWGLKTNMSAN